MPGKRKVTGVKPQFGHSRSKAFNLSQRKFKPNLQSKRFFLSDLDRFVRVRVTAKEIKTIDKIGLRAFLKGRGVSLESLL